MVIIQKTIFNIVVQGIFIIFDEFYLLCDNIWMHWIFFVLLAS